MYHEFESTSIPAPDAPSGIEFERHYGVPEIAKIWGLCVDTVREMFRNEPGVLLIEHPERLLARKRTHTTLRIPESVMRRVHRKWTTKSDRIV